MTLLQELGAVRQLYSEHMLLLGVVSGNFDARSLQLQRRFSAERLLRHELGRLLVLEERQATVTGHAVELIP